VSQAIATFTCIDELSHFCFYDSHSATELLHYPTLSQKS